ncbi:MAG: rRNA (cytosine1402-N4)-methyltransferase [Halanaerobiales bacterium]|nr:rRNA (cytosine1402-N4)-methyltransferase [Halanaerobiales bacterium]
MDTEHRPVLLEETINYLNCQKGGIYLDGTLGRGGHTEAILRKIDDRGTVIGIDRDMAAIKAVKKRLGGYKSLKLVHGNFIEIPVILAGLKIDRVDGMVFDLGVSSPQFDNPERGFSYRYDAPLDMRMNREQSLTAREIVNQYSREELTRIIKEYGEEKWASRIAQFIVDFRQKQPIETTFDLVEVIKAAIPAGARRMGGHPARRTFQALRIATNDELNQLEELITKAVPLLKPGGRICIISFHSLEDRIVKSSFRELAKDCVCPPDFPVCVCDHRALIKIITRRPVQPTKEEIETNPRARSAKLRVAEKF